VDYISVQSLTTNPTEKLAPGVFVSVTSALTTQHVGKGRRGRREAGAPAVVGRLLERRICIR